MGKYINKYISDNAVFYYRKNRVGGNDLWADKKESSKLQHNKFMIVNHYLSNSKDSLYDYNVYVTTANANDFNAVNSGILIRGNVDLYDAYNRYFMKLYAFYDNYTNFKCSVRSIGDENKVPTNPEDVYYPEYNPPFNDNPLLFNQMIKINILILVYLIA